MWAGDGVVAGGGRGGVGQGAGGAGEMAPETRSAQSSLKNLTIGPMGGWAREAGDVGGIREQCGSNEGWTRFFH